MELYDYYRSTASYRVRIALNLKNISYKKIPIHLINHGGEQHNSDYLALNPQGLVPALNENGHIITQSLAILEYLEEMNPMPPLLPQTPPGRAEVRSLALSIACDIHPLNNLRVLQRLKNQFKANDTETKAWYHYWLKIGFEAFEKRLQKLPRKQPVCYGDSITMADICLIPQVYNANRFDFSLKPYPLISAINEFCLSNSAFLTECPG